MLYSILKDDVPQNTIKRIKKIVSDLDIELEEEFFIENKENAPTSIRLSFKDNPIIGVNGKGTNKDNALASAYAEFIERLQNLVLFPNTWEYSFIISDSVKNFNSKIYPNSLKKYFSKKLSVYERVKTMKGNYDELFFCPFYSVKNKKVYRLPYNIIARIKGSNGMAAGNTLEEAFVQGASEVCERYALRETFLKKVALPNIPENEYLKYHNIRKIVDYFESNGFNIYVKDASLNGKVPVVCTIIEDTRNNIFCPSFGSHPSLPIAIERTLTEFAQGLMLSKLREFNFIGYQCYAKEKIKYTSYENFNQSLCLYKVAYEKTPKLEKIFFNKNVTYNYSNKSWINSEDTLYTNKELVNFLTNKILKISDDIYVRDVSFLGFPSIDIFVPQMSELFEYNEKNLHKRNLDRLWTAYQYNSKDQAYTIQSLLELSEIFSFTETLNCKKIFRVPFEYVALLCSIVLNDSKRILKYINVILGQNRLTEYYSKEQILTFNILREIYLNKKTNSDFSLIVSLLTKKYKKKDINYTLDIIENLTFEMILDIAIKKKKIKFITNKKLFKKLECLYKKNTPKQMSLANIFDC